MKRGPGECGRSWLGRRSEQIAAAHLRRQKMRIVARNERCRLGEIDIILIDRGGTVVFVEVKAKGGRAWGRPEEMVTAAKRRRLTLLAARFLRSRGWQGRPARFDVIALEWEGGRLRALRHHRNAFPASGPAGD